MSPLNSDSSLYVLLAGNIIKNTKIDSGSGSSSTTILLCVASFISHDTHPTFSFVIVQCSYIFIKFDIQNSKRQAAQSRQLRLYFVCIFLVVIKLPSLLLTSLYFIISKIKPKNYKTASKPNSATCVYILWIYKHFNIPKTWLDMW